MRNETEKTLRKRQDAIHQGQMASWQAQKHIAVMFVKCEGDPNGEGRVGCKVKGAIHVANKHEHVGHSSLVKLNVLAVTF